MLWLETDEQSVLIRGATPDYIPRLAPLVDTLRLRWDRAETAWRADGDLADVRKALDTQGLRVGEPPTDGFAAILKGRRGRARAKKRAGREAKAKASKQQNVRPPRGFTAIPKSSKGGYRKRVGKKYVYWYPDGSGERTRAADADVDGEAKALGEKLKAAHAEATTVSAKLASKVKTLSADVGSYYAKHHHKIDELIELVHVAETWAHLHGIHVKHVLSHVVHMAMSDDQSDVDLRKADEPED